MVNIASLPKLSWMGRTKCSLHWPGIEPGPPAWQARILPLNHQCWIPRIWSTSATNTQWHFCACAWWWEKLLLQQVLYVQFPASAHRLLCISHVIISITWKRFACKTACCVVTCFQLRGLVSLSRVNLCAKPFRDTDYISLKRAVVLRLAL